MMYLHKEGKVAEYAHSKDKFYYDIVDRPSGSVPFGNLVFDDGSQFQPGWFKVREEALQAAMDYHETEGCKLYLELYPAPEKGEYGFIAQDADGEWCGYNRKPDLKEDAWIERTSLDWHHICKSPPNPFWRKTLR